MKRTKLTAEEQLEVVLALLRKEEPARVLARRYGISEPTLYRMRERFLSGGKNALQSQDSDGQAKEIKKLAKELGERDRVIGELTIANRILKKTATGGP